MKGAWAMKLMYLKDILSSGRAAGWGLFFTFLSRTSGSSEEEGVPSVVFLACPMGVFSSSNEASWTRVFRFKTGINIRVLAEGTGICTLQWDRKSAETTFILGGKMSMANKKHEERCSKDCSPRSTYCLQRHTALMRTSPSWQFGDAVLPFHSPLIIL